SPISNLYFCLERLVHTVLAPRLGEHFKFDVGWLASLTAKVALDRGHLVQVERGAAFGGIEFSEGNVRDHAGRARGLWKNRLDGSQRIALDDGIRQQIARQPVQVIRREGTVPPAQGIALPRRRVLYAPDAQRVRAVHDLRRNRICYARSQRNLDDLFRSLPFEGRCAVAPGVRLDDGVGEEFRRKALQVVVAQLALQKIELMLDEL